MPCAKGSLMLHRIGHQTKTWFVPILCELRIWRLSERLVPSPLRVSQLTTVNYSKRSSWPLPRRHSLDGGSRGRWPGCQARLWLELELGSVLIDEFQLTSSAVACHQ